MSKQQLIPTQTHPAGSEEHAEPPRSAARTSPSHEPATTEPPPPSTSAPHVQFMLNTSGNHESQRPSNSGNAASREERMRLPPIAPHLIEAHLRSRRTERTAESIEEPIKEPVTNDDRAHDPTRYTRCFGMTWSEFTVPENLPPRQPEESTVGSVPWNASLAQPREDIYGKEYVKVPEESGGKDNKDGKGDQGGKGK